jgi:hypothetical protein
MVDFFKILFIASKDVKLTWKYFGIRGIHKKELDRAAESCVVSVWSTCLSRKFNLLQSV